ncbi:MAG: NYN domain-containing protein [Desulfobacca sp.]|nr:NYN domain-containing protein [Desulfobacca sp.]
MSVHLIIDGYNLIRQSPELLAFEAQDLQSGRQALLQKLAAYRQVRPHRITVVFDGWQSGELTENRDRYQGILIIYSRRGEPADEVIKRLAVREGMRALVVTSDREILDYVEQHGSTAISVPEFESRLHLAVDGYDDVNDDELVIRHTRKKGPAHRAPKKQRRQQQRLRKI